MPVPAPTARLAATALPSRGTAMAGGILLCVLLAWLTVVAATALHMPPVLLALGVGLAARPVATRLPVAAGLAFSGRTVLRLGIMLIGARLALHEVAALGLPAVMIAIGAVALTVAGGAWLARLCGLDRARSYLSAGSVGICGASAALAVSAVLPPSPARERETAYTVAAVTLLSTVAMVAYPAIAHALALTDGQAGVFFGASIHDLTQVVGAGALVSPNATEAATVTKLVRVACLAPAAIAIGLLFRARADAASAGAVRPPLLPWFLIGFAGLAAIANTGLLPKPAIDLAGSAATFCLVTATVALGIKTSPRALVADGWRPLAALLLQTLLVGAYALAAALLLIR